MFKKIAVAATLAILSTATMAADGRVYAGADFGKSKIDGFSDRETSVGAFVGYAITPAIAIEAGYRSLAEFDFAGADLSVDQIALSGVGTLPLSNNFNVYGRLGYNRVKVKGSGPLGSASGSESGVLYGVGLGYNFTPTVAGRIEVQKPTSDSTNLSAGVVFSF